MYSQQRRRPADEGLQVEFYLRALEDENETRKQGRPVFREREFIRINALRDTDGNIDRTFNIDTLVSPQYIQRFGAEYAAFKSNIKDVTEGTPITMWPAIGPAVVAELQGVGIRTVEQLAEVKNAPVWLEPHQAKAQEWLQVLANSGHILTMQASIDQLTRKVEELEATNKKLRAQLDKRSAGNDKTQ